MVSELDRRSTPHSPRVSRKRLEKRDKIIETAMALLAQGGLENVTVKRLAKELDYTPGALYRYFPSMDALFAQMQARAISALHRRISEAISVCSAESPLRQLRVAAQTYLGASDPESSHQLSLITQMLAAPQVLIADSLVSITAPKLIALLLLVDGLIAGAQEHGELSPGSSRNRAVQLWAALQGAIAIGKMSRYDASLFSASAVGESLLDNLLLAWGARPEEVSGKGTP